MVMPSTLLVATGLAVVNVLFLGVLTTVWLRNYRTFKTPLILGLLAFAVVLLIENLVAVAFFVDMRMLYAADPSVHQAVTVLRGLEFVALAFLTYSTVR